MHDERHDESATHGSGSFAILETRVPEPGLDYPRDEAELGRLLGSEAAAWRYLERLRFPRGFSCPSCAIRRPPWRSGAGLLACTACRQPVMLPQGTLFHGSVVPLSRWMRALWAVTDREDGISSAALQQTLGLPASSSAEASVDHLLGRIRHLMALPAQRKLAGHVGVAIGRVDFAGTRPAVVLAHEIGRNEPRVRLQHLPRVTANAIRLFVAANVAPGTTVTTTAWEGFAGIATTGVVHRTDPSREQADRFLGLLKLWLWSVTRPEAKRADGPRLQPHLDEFTFRFNRRSYPRGLLFYRLLILAVLYEHAKAGTLLESA